MDPRTAIDNIITTHVTRGVANSPGCSVAVAKNGRVFYSQAYGMADLDRRTPNTRNTVFFAASLSKQFTAMSILLLSRQKDWTGKPLVDLDGDVRDYLHELKHLPKITVRQLLDHTSGIPDMLIQLSLAGWRWGDDVIARDDVLNLASRMKTLNFGPGRGFAYSNTNYFLAGEIVRRQSGMPLAEFARKNIFQPLGMTRTRFVDSYCATVKNRAHGYRPIGEPGGFEKRTPNYDLSGPTSLFTTADDLLRWNRNFNRPFRVGGRDGVDELQDPQENPAGYALGLFVVKDSVTNKTQWLWHNGRTIGYRAHFYRDNLARISVALLCNVELEDVEATDNIVFAIVEAVQGRTYPVRSAPRLEPHVDTGPALTAQKLEAYCGKYSNSEIGAELEVERSGPSLVIRRPKYAPAHLTHFSDDTFIVQKFTAVLREVQFTFLRTGNRVTEFRLDWSQRLEGSRLTDLRFVKQP